jgi:hypothetical protein
VVRNLSITAGDNAGELDLQWDPAAGAKSYEVQVSPDPITATNWTSEPSVTKSRTAISGLMSGAKMWARVRAIGPGGTAHGAIRPRRLRRKTKSTGRALLCPPVFADGHGAHEVRALPT